MILKTKHLGLFWLVATLAGCATVAERPPVETVAVSPVQEPVPAVEYTPQSPEVLANPITVRVEKARRLLTIYNAGQVVKTYKIALGGDPVGHKTAAGDNKTPEGQYVIDWRNPQSRFFLSLHVNYPNAADRARAAVLGVPPGGDIMIHGIGTSPEAIARAQTHPDWTAGCIAVSDTDMQEIYALVPDLTLIQIDP